MKTALLQFTAILALATPALATENSVISCEPATIPATGKNGLKCHFTEKWEYVYGSSMLHVLGSTAEFARKSVSEECPKHGLAFEPHSNDKDQGYGTGGILNFKVETENRLWAVYAGVSGDFYCAKNKDLRFPN